MEINIKSLNEVYDNVKASKKDIDALVGLTDDQEFSVVLRKVTVGDINRRMMCNSECKPLFAKNGSIDSDGFQKVLRKMLKYMRDSPTLSMYGLGLGDDLQLTIARKGCRLSRPQDFIVYTEKHGMYSLPVIP
jgi:hypothetical protein